MTQVLALLLAATAVASEDAPPSGTMTAAEDVAAPGATAPEATTATAPEAAPSSGQVTPSDREPAKKPVAAQVALGVLAFGLLEGLFAGMSAGLATSPQAGWVIVALSPIAAGSGTSDQAAFNLGFVGGAVGLGLYNGLVLSNGHFSYSQRFWQNMVGWHVALGCGVLADHLAGPRRPSEPTVAISVGTTDGGPLLAVGGRF